MSNRNDASRLWVQKNLNRLAIRRALEQIQSTGRSLPCKVQAVNGQIVTVTFDVQSDVWALPPVTIPIASSVYDWIPVQVGDPGITMPCDVSIAPISGLGGSQAVLGETVGNLSSLMFVPVSNISLTPPGGDPNKRVMQGPTGFISQITGGATSVAGDSSSLTFAVGSITEVMSSSGVTFTVGSTTEVITTSGITWTTPLATVNGNFVVSGTITGNGSGGAVMQGAISSAAGISGATLSAGNGFSGTFLVNTSSQTVTVVNGIITGIS